MVVNPMVIQLAVLPVLGLVVWAIWKDVRGTKKAELKQKKIRIYLGIVVVALFVFVGLRTIWADQMSQLFYALGGQRYEYFSIK